VPRHETLQLPVPQRIRLLHDSVPAHVTEHASAVQVIEPSQLPVPSHVTVHESPPHVMALLHDSLLVHWIAQTCAVHVIA
jgi:hypothetical protein